MPILYVIAGPNGIGKTTSSYDLVSANIPIINSDEIAKEVRNSGMLANNANTQEYSNHEANRLIKEHLDKRASFAIETNLADDHTWRFLLETQRTGYQLHVMYVSTDDLSILNSRIQGRVLQGDHYVRPDIVKERYLNGLNLLKHYFKTPDILQLFDNTQTSTLVAEIELGQVMYKIEILPTWVITYLGECFGPQKEEEIKARNLNDINEVRDLYKKKSQ